MKKLKKEHAHGGALPVTYQPQSGRTGERLRLQRGCLRGGNYSLVLLHGDGGDWKRLGLCRAERAGPSPQTHPIDIQQLHDFQFQNRFPGALRGIKGHRRNFGYARGVDDVKWERGTADISEARCVDIRQHDVSSSCRTTGHSRGYKHVAVITHPQMHKGDPRGKVAREDSDRQPGRAPTDALIRWVAAKHGHTRRT